MYVTESCQKQNTRQTIQVYPSLRERRSIPTNEFRSILNYSWSSRSSLLAKGRADRRCSIRSNLSIDPASKCRLWDFGPSRSSVAVQNDRSTHCRQCVLKSTRRERRISNSSRVLGRHRHTTVARETHQSRERNTVTAAHRM